MITFGAYFTVTFLNDLRGTKRFNPGVRNFLANYRIVITLVIWSCVCAAFPLVHLDFLRMSSEGHPTYRDPKTHIPRKWIVNPMGTARPFPIWAMIAAAIPALGYSCLHFMEKNVTSILVNRRSWRLKTPPAYRPLFPTGICLGHSHVGAGTALPCRRYHLDLLILGVCVYPLCAILGVPYPQGSTVRSQNYIAAVTVRENGNARVIEQRVSNIIAHALLLIAIGCAAAFRRVPMAVLFGLFLFMGVMALNSNQMFQRIRLWDNWDRLSAPPRFAFVKEMGWKKFHAFTLVQVACLVMLYLSTKGPVALAFPIFLILIAVIRKFMGKPLPHLRLWKESELELMDDK
jgi:hypothetical protein